MSGMINTSAVTQVGLIVKDIVKTKQKFAEFFGVEPPEHFTGGEYDITRTTVLGEPAPYANCLLAFFNVGPNLQLELIQPNGYKSTWQDFLDKFGEGIHHIAFNINDMNVRIKNMEEHGFKCVQRGRYGDASGEYAYMDCTADLKCIIELLESY